MPPPTPLNVVLVQVLDSSHCVIQFDGDPLVNSLVADGNFLINGGGCTSLIDLGGGAVEMDAGISGPVMSSGDAWDITGQLAWATAPIAFPQTGISF